MPKTAIKQKQKYSSSGTQTSDGQRDCSGCGQAARTLEHWLDSPAGTLHTHTRLTALFPGLPGVRRYQKGRTNLDFTEARDSEWQWHQLGRMQVCTSLQTDNHASTPPLSFLQAGCPSCRPTNSVKALKAWHSTGMTGNLHYH